MCVCVRERDRERENVCACDLVVGGLAAAEVIVVHAGKIIVNERHGVDHFRCYCRWHRHFLSVLQCVGSVLQCVAVCCSVLQCVGSVLQCVAVCCSVLQCVAVCRSE